jgi:hypothetical protein
MVSRKRKIDTHGMKEGNRAAYDEQVLNRILQAESRLMDAGRAINNLGQAINQMQLNLSAMVLTLEKKGLCTPAEVVEEQILLLNAIEIEQRVAARSGTTAGNPLQEESVESTIRQAYEKEQANGQEAQGEAGETEGSSGSAEEVESVGDHSQEDSGQNDRPELREE